MEQSGTARGLVGWLAGWLNSPYTSRPPPYPAYSVHSLTQGVP